MNNTKSSRKEGILKQLDLAKVSGKIKKQAMEVYRFIKQNPYCSRADICRVISWANHDNINYRLRVLNTQRRIVIKKDKSTYRFVVVSTDVAWSNHMLNEGKIEKRQCGGTNSKGEPCRVPDLYVRENGYCMHHGPDAESMKEQANEKRLKTRTENKESMQDRMRRRRNERHQSKITDKAIEEAATEAGIFFDEDGRMIFEPQDAIEATVIPQYHHEDNPDNSEWITVRIPIPKQDDTEIKKLRAVIRRFLDGKATMQDLREAVE